MQRREHQRAFDATSGEPFRYCAIPGHGKTRKQQHKHEEKGTGYHPHLPHSSMSFG